MSLAELRAGLPLPPPHPATKATRSNAKNHLSVVVILSNLFIMLLLYLIQKNICAINRPLAGTDSTYPVVLRQHSLLTCFAAGETTDETTDRTTSHLTNPVKDAVQVIGYS